MTALARVERARRTLRIAAVAGAALRGVCTALALLLAAALVDAFVVLPAVARRPLPVVAIAAGLVVFVQRMRRSGVLAGGGTLSAALWIEARHPSLRYALVTAIDPAYAGRVPDLERVAATVTFEPDVTRAARRVVRTPATLVVLLLLLIAVLPTGAVARVVRPRGGDLLDHMRGRTGGGNSNALAAIVVRATPPAYAEQPTQTLENPASLRALAGSAISIEGRTGDAGVILHIGDRELAAMSTDTRWHLALAMPAVPTATRLRSAAHERLLVLDPVVDSAPVVTLMLPSRDSIYRSPAGAVRLAADVTDDIGLAGGDFEYIVSSGSGETFTFKSGTIGAAALTGRSSTLAATLRLDSLGLRPGDLIHIRAVARDRNNVTGPGVGASETRTLRIARADEYDSVAVDPAPPPEPERDALSQRMILLLTEALEHKRPTLAHSDLVRESGSIATDQARLRKRIGSFIFARLGEAAGEEGDAADKRTNGPLNPDSVLALAARASSASNAGAALEGNEDETPVVAMNRPLLAAYNFMWSAGSELEVAEPAKAIPWMRKALDALQSARAAERIYLRGRTRAVVVDIERVRLQGKDKGTPDRRTPRLPVDPDRAARLARFDAALALAASAPAAAADSLLLIRIDVLDRDAAAARALESAANALRGASGIAATDALIRARRALSGAVIRSDSLAAWGTIP